MSGIPNTWCAKDGHLWVPVLWRMKGDAYQRGCICSACPAVGWLSEDFELVSKVFSVESAQHAWWLARAAREPYTPWVEISSACSRNPGPLNTEGIDLREDQLGW